MSYGSNGTSSKNEVSRPTKHMCNYQLKREKKRSIAGTQNSPGNGEQSHLQCNMQPCLTFKIKIQQFVDN